MVRVQSNSKGGTINLIEHPQIEEPLFAIDVIEERRAMDNIHPELGVRTMSIDIRKAQIMAPLRVILLIKPQVPGILPGKIVHKYSTNPPDGSDIEQWLFWQDNKVRRTRSGAAIYKFSYYTEDPSAIDEDIPQ